MPTTTHQAAGASRPHGHARQMTVIVVRARSMPTVVARTGWWVGCGGGGAAIPARGDLRPCGQPPHGGGGCSRQVGGLRAGKRRDVVSLGRVTENLGAARPFDRMRPHTTTAPLRLARRSGAGSVLAEPVYFSGKPILSVISRTTFIGSDFGAQIGRGSCASNASATTTEFLMPGSSRSP